MISKIFKQYLPKWLVLLFLLLVANQSSLFVEQFYSRGIYIIFRNIDLFFLRLVPFSIGDLLYIGFPVWFSIKIYKRFKSGESVFDFIEKIIWHIVFWFYLLWGINYFRQPIYIQEGLEITRPGKQEIMGITSALIDSLNRYQMLLTADAAKPVRIKNPELLPKQAEIIFNNQQNIRPYLTEAFYVIKPSILSKPVSYLQVSGYFNPFTHEAQYNTLFPLAYRPHIILHELAHQIGFAYENEAEFIAWLTAMESDNVLFKYSAQLNALEYFLISIQQTEPEKSKNLIERLNPGVRKNMQEAADFMKKHYIKYDLSKPYDYYLKINQQGKGREAYSEVILYIYAHYNKNKHI